MAENGSVSEWCVLIAELFFLKRKIFGLGFSNTVVRVISLLVCLSLSVLATITGESNSYFASRYWTLKKVATINYWALENS
jgi:hypothetical protein